MISRERVVWIGLGALSAVAVAYAVIVLLPRWHENNRLAEAAADIEDLSRKRDEVRHKIQSLSPRVERQRRFQHEYIAGFDAPRCANGAYTEITHIAERYGVAVVAMKHHVTEPDETSDWQGLQEQVSLRLDGAWRSYTGFRKQLAECACLLQIISEHVTAQPDGSGVTAELSLIVFRPQVDDV